jgi:hypothetical protein
MLIEIIEDNKVAAIIYSDVVYAFNKKNIVRWGYQLIGFSTAHYAPSLSSAIASAQAEYQMNQRRKTATIASRSEGGQYIRGISLD